jgi:transposase
VPLQGRLAAVAIEATTGWRWVCRELNALGFDVRLVDPAQAKALRGRTRRAKTDRLDPRWLCLLLATAMLRVVAAAGGDPGAARSDAVA